MTSTQKRRANPHDAAPASVPRARHASVEGASIAENATAPMEGARPRMGVRVVECEVEPGQTAFATEQERQVLARQRSRAPAVALPHITLDWVGEELCFLPEYIDEAIGWQVLMDAFASTNRCFVEGLLKQLLAVTENNSEQELNFLVSIVAGLQPRDEAEALLATNIAVGQAWTMRWALRLNYTSGAIQDEMFVGMYTKLAAHAHGTIRGAQTLPDRRRTEDRGAAYAERVGRGSSDRRQRHPHQGQA